MTTFIPCLQFQIRREINPAIKQKEIKNILDKLGLNAVDIVRKKEPIFLEKFKGKTFTNTEWIQILTEHPILIERPIIIDGYKAVIGRPTELIIDLLKRTN